ncbi:hypothetical protein LTR37_018185 [Vermiconidia calcicola]|uniref:Uncharacterized protein n=1 Tax=Vermiconidia calcicola TaxID=1690605 RepID=A0ACC3MJJ9_9PEZI|nr:hypothetical protein LTR37_018185 [Vermiconidia calcicola]
MAMEKLILRSVLYGADKIPDSWFDKIPGGFYKDKNGETQKKGHASKDKRRHSTHDGRKVRDEDRNYEDRERSGRRRDRDRDRERDRRSRSSYDGGDDEELYDSGDDRRRPRRAKSDKRRHSYDDDRYGHDDGYDREPRNGYGVDRQRSVRDSRPRDSYYDRERPSTGGGDRRGPPNTMPPNAYGTARGSAPTNGAATYPHNSDASSPTVTSPQFTQAAQPSQARPGSVGNGYIPYAHIYGQSPPQSAKSSKEPNRVNRPPSPIISSQPGYRQNPFAQEAPTAADAGAGMQYNTGDPGIINQDSRSGGPSDLHYNGRRDSGEDYRRARSERRTGDRRYDPDDQDREAYVDPRKPLNTQASTKPPTATMNDRRKGDQPDSNYQRDGGNSRRNARRSRRDEGYYSD